ncbi:MAG TPA: hypothetical protein VIX19_00280 [Terriglobales bacterium]
MITVERTNGERQTYDRRRVQGVTPHRWVEGAPLQKAIAGLTST